MVGVGDGEGLGKLLGVEGDGLLAQDVLTRAERAAQVVDVRVVRRGDVDRVDVGGGIEVLEGVVDLGDAPALGEGLGLLAVVVGHAHELAAGQGERLGHLVGDNAAADDGPAQLGGSEDVRGERLVLRRGEGLLRGGCGIERGVGGKRAILNV